MLSLLRLVLIHSSSSRHGTQPFPIARPNLLMLQFLRLPRLSLESLRPATVHCRRVSHQVPPAQSVGGMVSWSAGVHSSSAERLQRGIRRTVACKLRAPFTGSLRPQGVNKSLLYAAAALNTRSMSFGH